MEEPRTSPNVQSVQSHSPRIQFHEPSFPLSGGPGIGIGPDGRRLSMANSTNEVFIDDDPTEDWTRTTAEKDSWAHRERRRSSVWHKIDSYPSTKPPESSSPTRSRSERRGSILSLFKHGKDKNGRDVLHSGDADDWSRENAAAAAAAAAAQVETPQPDKEMPRDRRGSILSMWTWGKDKAGRDVIHSGFESDSD